jgi:hypothetical protein
MKLAEALYERKKIETRILRLMEYRKEIFRKSFPEIKDEDIKSRDRRYKIFLKSIGKQIHKINEDIDLNIKEYLDLAHKINIQNLELELDKKLLEMKFIRLELSSLDRLRKSGYVEEISDLERIDMLKIDQRLELIEEKKRRLDNTLQQLNHTNEVML